MKKALTFVLILTCLTTFGQPFNSNLSQDIIKVKGEFITKQKPENLVVSLSVTEEDDNYKKCFAKAFETREKMVAAFESNGIDRTSVKTKDLTVKEQYRWEEHKDKSRYIAYINMEIEEVYTEKFAEMLLKSLQDYTFQVNYSIHFTLSETQKTALRKKAIEEAVKDAVEKAAIISTAANVRLGDINRISYGDSWDAGYSNNIDDDLVTNMEYDSYMAMEIPVHNSGIDFNPKEVSIKKVIMIEWKILKE